MTIVDLVLRCSLSMEEFCEVFSLRVVAIHYNKLVQSIGYLSTKTVSPLRSGGRDEKPTSYEYKYEVSDHQTGDRKSHWEKRDGHNVRGVYTLYEPDGVLRTVEYTADAVHGFNAVVKRNEPMHQQQHNKKNQSPSSRHDGYDSNIEYSSESHSYLNQETDVKLLKGTNSLTKGVDFSVVHIY